MKKKQKKNPTCYKAFEFLQMFVVPNMCKDIIYCFNRIVKAYVIAHRELFCHQMISIFSVNIYI